MGAGDQPRDSWGRWTARPGGRATAPVKPKAAPVYKDGTREVHLTKERAPHYQVWDGDALVAEKPAGRAWKRDQDEAIALARGIPRDTSNLADLSDKSHHAVINSVLRGARASQPGASGIRLRSKAEIELAHTIAENMRRENASRDPDELRQQADYIAAQHAAAGGASVQAELARQRVTQNDLDTLDEDAAREAEHYG
ncbi:hypothetical protein K2Z83_13375 [Oscillochloris sp. ZM17-4]|uniref:hypothetical protein n=1 Tax=Oscillochloris sp. ZM17-4 TaxID=2866714 RepID=UPI001C731B53|nr:hypothetical protein [Oscillochloris sp. ZM17-4]MBX0328667.1 hypothetical protein [Oscillochloris sp. ZM17-4]